MRILDKYNQTIISNGVIMRRSVDVRNVQLAKSGRVTGTVGRGPKSMRVKRTNNLLGLWEVMS